MGTEKLLTIVKYHIRVYMYHNYDPTAVEQGVDENRKNYIIVKYHICLQNYDPTKRSFPQAIGIL